MENTITAPVIVTPEAMLEHWQGHRRLTRRVIEAFPENELFSFSIGGMRPFAKLAHEMINIAGAGVQGIATGTWPEIDWEKAPFSNKAELLKKWDEITATINTFWPQIAIEKFSEPIVSFGQYEMPGYAQLFYFVENEVHHRGQGYVYLRSLGIEPPKFWER